MGDVARFLNPYDTALEYRKAGWGGPLPLPYKEKHPPPLDYTKRVSEYPTIEKIAEWMNDGKKHNICCRLAGVTEEHELLGIDVDDYWKGDKKKEGFAQLRALEDKLGKLPTTWISSARTDGKSGIRYFRVPRGLAFRGKVDKDIEVIRKGHRFAVVWPSIHPEGGTYWWFEPGVRPDKEAKSIWDGTLPDARQLPLLPDAWIDYLTNGRTEATDDELIDVDSSVDEVMAWARDIFYDFEGSVCSKTAEKLELHKKNIEDEATSHDKLTNGHWNLCRLGAEGHHGVGAAMLALEDSFKEITLARGKRGLQEVHGEIFRSRIQALRKIKGQIDDRIKIGAKAVDPSCQKIGLCGTTASQGLSGNLNVGVNSDGKSIDPPNELDDVPKGPTGPMENYKTHDDDNARLFKNYFTSEESDEPSIHYADGYGWIVWHERKPNPYWEHDENGNQIVRRMWRVIRDLQYNYAGQLAQNFAQSLTAASQQPGTPLLTASGNPSPGTVLAAQKAEMTNRLKWAERSGNKEPAEKAIDTLKTLKGISVKVEDLNSNDFLLGVANGVVELDDQVRLRPAYPSDLITFNTNIPWEEPSDYPKDIWKDYLDTFIPDQELQKALQIAFGYCLTGGNPQQKLFVLKGGTNTGKSTLIGAIEACLGDYAQSVNQSIFQQHKLNPVLARAMSKRVVFCSEFGGNSEISGPQLKQITGEDVIQAELKGSNVTIEGHAKFVPVIATNVVPKIDAVDKALEQRLHVFPFDVTIQNIDISKKRVLEDACQIAVLNWLVEGYKEYRKLGFLPVTQSMRQATDRFMAESNDVSAFVDECLEKVPGQHVSKAEMYRKYRDWWRDENQGQEYNCLTKNKFGRELRSLGIKTQDKNFRVDGKLDYWWIGVKIKKSNVVSMTRDFSGVARLTQQKAEDTTPKNTS